MRTWIVAGAAFCVAAALAPAWAQSNPGLQRAKNTVNNLPGDGAVRADTRPKPSPVGQPVSDYKPPVRVKPAAPPPPPPPAKKK